VALKSIPKLKAIFDTYYSKEPKKFIETFTEHKELPVDEIITLFEKKTSNKSAIRAEFNAICIVGKTQEADVAVRADMFKYTALIYNAGASRKIIAGVEAVINCEALPKEESVYAVNI
jgi:hypothetical protein